MEFENTGLIKHDTQIEETTDAPKSEVKEKTFDAKAHLNRIMSETKESILKSEFLQDFLKNLHPDNAKQVISIINKNINHSSVSKTLKLVKQEVGDLLVLANGSEHRSQEDLTKDVLVLAREIIPIVEDNLTDEKILGNINDDSDAGLESRIKDLELAIGTMPYNTEKTLFSRAITTAKMNNKKR